MKREPKVLFAVLTIVVFALAAPHVWQQYLRWRLVTSEGRDKAMLLSSEANYISEMLGNVKRKAEVEKIIGPPQNLRAERYWMWSYAPKEALPSGELTVAQLTALMYDAIYLEFDASDELVVQYFRSIAGDIPREHVQQE